jgi:hypothetical protein
MMNHPPHPGNEIITALTGPAEQFRHLHKRVISREMTVFVMMLLTRPDPA